MATPQPSAVETVSLEDVKNHTPSESNEESLVLRSIEEGMSSPSSKILNNSNDSNQTTSTRAHPILDSVPAEASHVFQNEIPVPDSIEKELFDLTNQMKTDQQETVINDDLPNDTNNSNNNGGKDPNSNSNNDNNNNNLGSSTRRTFRRNASSHPKTGAADKVTESFAAKADYLFKQAHKASSKWNHNNNNNGSHHHHHDHKGAVEDFYMEFKKFLQYRKQTTRAYMKNVLQLILVATGVAALFFYVLEDPEDFADDPTTASTSWWILFVLVRQPITLSLAKCIEVFVIDFLCLNRTFLIKLLGPFFTLLLVQSKGWPFQLMMWGIIDFIMLYGKKRFPNHWLFYQDLIDMCNATNPSGTVLQASSYRGLLFFSIFGGLAVAVKRFSMGLFYGKGVYRRYGKDLMTIMKKSMLISKLSSLATKEANHGGKISKGNTYHFNYSDIHESINKGKDENNGFGDDDTDSGDDDDSTAFVVDTRKRDVFSGSLAASQKIKIRDLLGEWEEPITDEREVEDVSISSIVQFRSAAACTDTKFPFSTRFGPAGTREQCIESSQKLYLALKDKDSPVLKFEDVATIAVKDDGTLNEPLIKDLIACFRPTRDGELTMLDFVKSIDTIYKELRLIRASILNAQKMNAASQKVWDVVFYIVMICILLAVIGIDPLALIGSLLAVIVGLSFMVGSALAKAFEGLLLVLVRKPYDVGDRIAIGGCNQDASGTGSAGWIVKDLDLYNTTLIYGTTGEEATITNGYINEYRIINMNRSPKAVLNFVMKFGIEVSKEKIAEFGKEVESYVKDRPREWIAFSAYRLTGVEADLGYVEYKIILQHRESWQQIGALLTSKADVQAFAFELSKTLEMDYEQPATPIIVSRRDNKDGTGSEEKDPLFGSLMGSN